MENTQIELFKADAHGSILLLVKPLFLYFLPWPSWWIDVPKLYTCSKCLNVNETGFYLVPYFSKFFLLNITLIYFWPFHLSSDHLCLWFGKHLIIVVWFNLVFFLEQVLRVLEENRSILRLLVRSPIFLSVSICRKKNMIVFFFSCF